jgi:hypothetical protein
MMLFAPHISPPLVEPFWYLRFLFQHHSLLHYQNNASSFAKVSIFVKGDEIPGFEASSFS